MIKVAKGAEFCIIGVTNKIHVRTQGASYAKCGAGKPRRRGGIVAFISRCDVQGANDRLGPKGGYTMCAICAAHTATESVN